MSSSTRPVREPDLSSVDGSDDDNGNDAVDRLAGSPGGRVSDRAPGSKPTSHSTSVAQVGQQEPNFINFYGSNQGEGLFSSPILPLHSPSSSQQHVPPTAAARRAQSDDHYDAVPMGRLSDHDHAARIAVSALEALRHSLQLRGDDDLDAQRRSPPQQHGSAGMLPAASGISPERNLTDFIFDEDDDDGFASGPSTVHRAPTSAQPSSNRVLATNSNSNNNSSRTMAMVDQALIAAIWGNPQPNNGGGSGGSDTDQQGGASQPSSQVSPVDAYPLEPPQHTADRSLEDIVASYERGSGDVPPYIVCVQALDPRTSSKALQDVFFPMGSQSAVVLYRDDDINTVMHATAIVIIESQEYQRTHRPDELVPVPYPLSSLIRRRVVGLVFFKNEDIARFAAQKMHDFVPHGQSNPLHSAVAVGVDFANAVKRCWADPEACIARMHAHQPATTASAGQSHNGSLQDVTTNTGVSRRLVNALQTMFGSMRKPLASLGHIALRFASVLVEADSGRGMGAPERIIAPCTALIDACTEGSEVDAAESIALLSEAISAQYRGVLRVVDLASRRVSEIIKNGGYRADLLLARFQVPLCKNVLNGLIFSPDRMKRIGCASAAASLFDQGLISGSPFALCVRLFTQKVLNQPQTPQRDGLVEAIVIFAACAKTCSRLRAAVGSSSSTLTLAGADLLAGPTTYPFTSDPAPTEGLERDFVAALARFREDQATLHHHHSDAVGNSGSGQYHAAWPPRSDEVLPSARPTRTTTASAHDSSTGSVNITGTSAGAGQGANMQHVHDVTPPSSPGSMAANPSAYPQPLQGGSALGHAVSRAAISGLPPARHVDTVPPTQVPSTLNADILPCTVYVTRVPASLSEPRLRTLLAHHGELNKVRLYATAKRGQHDREDLAFAFVEFRTQTAARNLVMGLDRATLHFVGPSPDKATWHVTPHGAAPDFPSDANVLVVSTLRCSPARSAIHDHDPRDAVFDSNGKIRECLFGLLPRQTTALPTQPSTHSKLTPVVAAALASTASRTPTSSAASSPAQSAGNTPSRPQGTANVSTGGLNVSAAPWGRGGSSDGPLPSERRIVHPPPQQQQQLQFQQQQQQLHQQAGSQNTSAILSADSSGFIVTSDA